MSNVVKNKRAPFTYIWAIENFYKSIAYQKIKSPKFTVDSMEKTKWRLKVTFSRISHLTLYIKRMKDDEGPSERMEIEFEMSLLGADGSPL
ncbi:hypothetical protein NPIL_258791, partial [Nephila pilipes]